MKRDGGRERQVTRGKECGKKKGRMRVKRWKKYEENKKARRAKRKNEKTKNEKKEKEWRGVKQNRTNKKGWE